MFNEWTGIGRVVRDPELRYTPSGVPVANFSLAVDRDFKNADGRYDTDFLDCVAWRKPAEILGEHATKGRLLAITGSLQKRSYDAQDGTKRTVVEVQVTGFKFLDASSKSHEEAPASAEVIPVPDDGMLALDDVPF